MSQDQFEAGTSCPTCHSPYGKRRRCYKCNRGGSPMAGEDRACEHCGKTFYAPRWKLNDVERNQGAYCSRECKYEAAIVPPSGMLRCRRCGVARPRSEFGDDRRTRSGKKGECNTCN